ncbi:MAG: aldo/keto reductase [Gammaproteobacteria bacterium]|nr:aldo/keto reductase [Gammaproteobacteria bacterium]
MEYRLLGNTDLRVSTVGFGAWQLGNAAWNGPDEATSVELVHAALDAGCNFFDTAPDYGSGASERILGKALQGRRGQVVLCTKYGHADPRQADFSAGGTAACARSQPAPPADGPRGPAGRRESRRPLRRTRGAAPRGHARVVRRVDRQQRGVAHACPVHL